MKHNYTKKKITFFINSLDSGGSERQLLYLIRLLKKKFEIEIFSFKRGLLLNDFKKENIKIISADNNFFSFIFLVFYLFFNKSQIYHFILPKSYIIVAILSFFSKKKKVMSRRSLNYYHNKYYGMSLFVEKFLHKKMNHILCNSEAIKKQLIDLENVNAKKIKTIKNFYPVNKFIKSSLFEFSIKKNYVNFAYLANFIEYKGHVDLIKICSNLKTKKNWNLFLVGKGSKRYINELKKIVKKKKLNSKIFFIGYINNPMELYKKMDFAINCSNEEGSSNALLEAISLSLPIISFDVGGNSDFFSNNGYLIKYKDIKTFTESLDKLIESKEKKKLGKNSYLHFKKEFNNSKNLRKYEDIYLKF